MLKFLINVQDSSSTLLPNKWPSRNLDLLSMNEFMNIGKTTFVELGVEVRSERAASESSAVNSISTREIVWVFALSALSDLFVIQTMLFASSEKCVIS
jgi:hypothetical protein